MLAGPCRLCGWRPQGAAAKCLNAKCLQLPQILKIFGDNTLIHCDTDDLMEALEP